ncbi:hypothetical protein TI39_contig455g00012 [Zymoseptoria brevis]|uniref:Uncharacterized protein n=1 Tax=Zymoseptoria brevis TaxID=1047168 RepID=A0A0F4GNS7_9PEZI|nr:hypothetical protein TI39_contig455g00012 [Zymoseptoria brevis]
MRLMQGVLLLGAVALGNPVAEIQERQAPAASACSTLAGRCTRVASLQSSASAFCSSLGFGTLINTVKTTVVDANQHCDYNHRDNNFYRSNQHKYHHIF